MATPREVRDRLAKQADTYPRVVLATALFGLISATFMVSVLAAVVGTLATEFGTTTSTMVWVVVGPNLGFAVLAVSSGKLADMYGRRRAFLGALVGSMIFGASPLCHGPQARSSPSAPSVQSSAQPPGQPASPSSPSSSPGQREPRSSAGGAWPPPVDPCSASSSVVPSSSS